MLSLRLRQSKENQIKSDLTPSGSPPPQQVAAAKMRQLCHTSQGTHRSAVVRSSFKARNPKSPALQTAETIDLTGTSYTEDIRSAVAKAIHKQKLNQKKLQIMLHLRAQSSLESD